MKRLIKSSIVLLALLGVVLTSCKKEYPTPPIPVLPVGTVYTIDQILSLESGHVFPADVDASVYGIVTADEVSGNLYKAAFIQDRTTGAALELYMDATSGVRIGDSIRVYLPGVTYTVYNNLPQLSGFEPDGHIIILANNKPIEPIVTTIANINAGQHLAQLIKLENVKFSDQNTFAEPTTYGNRTLIDPTDPTNSVIVRTSNYANFANDSLPQGTGNLVAIASVYNTTWQLYIRSASELEFDGFNPGGGGGNNNNELPYFQDFTSSFGTYTTYSVEGDQEFEIDYSTAKMTGYANGTNYVNEDWLLSAPVALTDVEHVKVSVNYVAQYQNANTEDVTLQISRNYTTGTDPQTADWTQMNVTYPNTSGWSDFQTVETSLDEFLGETVTVAIKYTSSATQARTLEVKYIVIQEGEVGGGVTPPDPPTPGELEGDGSRENPYTANDILLLGVETSDGNKYWVRDYIVGVIDNYVYQFNSATEVKTNLILSSNLNASGEDECVPVQLPTGDVRNGLNLAENPGNLGQEVLLYGTLEKYFRVPGVKNVTYAEINGNAFGTEPGGVEPPTPGNEIFSETFANGQGTFVIEDVLLTDPLTYVWSHASNYSCMKASAYVGQAYETESWLVSPYISLEEVTSATLTFEQAVNYASPQGALAVMVSTEYVDTVDGIEWDELTLSSWPAGSNWDFITSTADLTPYAGQRVTIAFKYTSTSSASATWEVKNIVVE